MTLANANNAPYMYDERRYGGVPSKDDAQGLLSDLKTGNAYLHPIHELGCMDRLEAIATGRDVDPKFWQRQDDVGRDQPPVRKLEMAENLEGMKASVRQIDAEVKIYDPAFKIVCVLTLIFFCLVNWIGWPWFLTAVFLLPCIAARTAHLHHRALKIEDRIRAIDPTYE